MEPIRNNQTKPNQTQTTPIGVRGGVNRSRVQVQSGGFEGKSPAEKRSSARFRQAYEFAARELPGEVDVLVAAAFMAEAFRLRRDPSRQEVLDRLVATGRDAKSWRAEQ